MVRNATPKRLRTSLLSMPRKEAVRFFIAPVDGLTLRVIYAQQEPGMNEYVVIGKPAAVSLLNRLTIEGQDATNIRGVLSPMSPVSLDENTKMNAGIPRNAKFFAYAYPLDCLAADTASMLSLIIGSMSRLDDELFFFFLLGGFVYFDESQSFLQANAISFKQTDRELRFDGPFHAKAEAADVLKRSGRLRPLSLRSLNDVGLLQLGWVNPMELPGGFMLHDTVDWKSGALVFGRADGQTVFYSTKTGKLNHAEADERAKGWAKSWAKEHRGFELLQENFEAELDKSHKLRASLMRQQAGPVETWLRSYGVVIAAYYSIGTLLFHYIEGFAVFDCIYFMTVTATTVGYGDLSPATELGRGLAVVYMPLGTVVTLGGLIPPVGYCLRYLEKLSAFVVAKLNVLLQVAATLYSQKIHLAFGPSAHRARASWRREAGQTFTLDRLFGGPVEVGPAMAYLHAAFQPVVVVLIGCIVTSAVKGTSFVDSLYYGVVTMTTVGYGDSEFLPHSDAEKAYTILFMLFSTTSLAVCVTRLDTLIKSRQIFKRDFSWELPSMMRKRALKQGELSPTLDEDQFVLYVLQLYGEIDEDLLKCIRNDFRKLENIGVHPCRDNGQIEIATLFDHLVTRGQVTDSNRVAPDTTREDRQRTRTSKSNLNPTGRKLIEVVTVRGGPSLPSEMVVDMSTPDNGFAEWYDDIWTPFLEQDAEYQQSRGEQSRSTVSRIDVRRPSVPPVGPGQLPIQVV